MEKGQTLIYVDGLGKEHDALAKIINPRDPSLVTLVYIDVNAPENDNLKLVWDVQHMTDPAKQEPNPDLPRYVVNCWKWLGEYHLALPEDHPAFDHPFKEKDKDQDGNFIPVARPEFASDIAHHLGEPANMQEALAEQNAAPSGIESQHGPDYPELRAQLNDYDTIFYGPHPCTKCGFTIVKGAEEHGGHEYEWDGIEHKYQAHVCHPLVNVPVDGDNAQ